MGHYSLQPREANKPTLGGNNNTGMKAGYVLHDAPYEHDKQIDENDIAISIDYSETEIALGNTITLGEPMNHLKAAKNIETLTLIKGHDASNMSDDAILDLISSLEEQINRYTDMKTTTQTANNKINALKADIAALVIHLDGASDSE